MKERLYIHISHVIYIYIAPTKEREWPNIIQYKHHGSNNLSSNLMPWEGYVIALRYNLLILGKTPHPTWTVLKVQRSDTTSRDQPRCPEAMFLHSGLRIDPKEQAHQDLRPPQQSSQNIRCTAKCRAECGLDPAIQSPLYLSAWDAMLRSYHGCLFRFIPPERRHVSFEPSPGLQHFQQLRTRIIPFSDEFAIAYPCCIRCTKWISSAIIIVNAHHPLLIDLKLPFFGPIFLVWKPSLGFRAGSKVVR